MSTRRFGRRPNRRQLDLSLLNEAQMALEVISFTTGAGNTVIRLGLLSALAQVVVTPNGALSQTIILFGNLGPDLQQTACQGIADGGAYAEGRYADLTFLGEYDADQPWELQIPSDFPNLRAGIAGRLSGTFAESQSGAGESPPFVRVGNITRLVTPGARLMYVAGIAADGSPVVTVTLITPDTGLLVSGSLTLATGGTPTTATPTALNATQFTFPFASNVNIGDNVSNTIPWQPELRGDNGAWLVPWTISAT